MRILIGFILAATLAYGQKLESSPVAAGGSGGGGSGTVSSVATGCGAAGGTITTTGTIRVSEAVNAQTGTSYTLLDGDCGKLVTHSNSSATAYTLPQANGSTFIAGWFVDLQNRGAGTVTVTPTTSTVDGAATLTLGTGQGVRVVSNGTNYFTVRGRGIVSVNGDTTPAQVIAPGTSGSDFGVSSSGGTTTLNLPNASATARGALSSADWSAFDGKLAATSAAVIGLFAGCSGVKLLGADGDCHDASGGSAAGTEGQIQYNSGGAFGAASAVWLPAPYSVVFGGSGPNDATFSGTNTVTAQTAIIYLKIASTGAPDTFCWWDEFADVRYGMSCGGLGADIDMTGGVQALANGLSVQFTDTTGHTVNDDYNLTATGPTLDLSSNNIINARLAGSNIAGAPLANVYPSSGQFLGFDGTSYTPTANPVRVISVPMIGENLAIGPSTLIGSLANAGNVGVGIGVMPVLTSGDGNTALGSSVMTATTNGSQNTVVGGASLNANVGGSENTTVGYYSQPLSDYASKNTSLGSFTLWTNVGGDDNTAIGSWSFKLNEGSNNIGLGYYAGAYQTTQSNSLFIDGIDRLTEADEQANSLIVGHMDADPANQTLVFHAGLTTNSYSTGTNCSSSASPAVCASAVAGSVAIPTGITSVALTVNTTAVTANSQIFVVPDDTLGSKLSVTCNSTLATLVGGMAITARTAGTSFEVTYNGTIATNPLCVSYLIVN